MRNFKLMVVIGAVLALAACAKKDDGKAAAKGKDKGGEKDKDKDKGKTPEPPKTLSGADLGKVYVDGWAALVAADWAKFGALYTADAKSHWVDSGMPDLVGSAAIVDGNAKPFRAAWSDFVGAPQLVLVNGRTVASISLVGGTHTGPIKTPMGDIPATNKKLGQLTVHIVTFNDANMVTEEWFIQDGGSMMMQLGLAPGPGRALIEKGMDGAPMIVVAADNDVEKANLALWNKGTEAFNKHDLAGLMADAADDVLESDQASPVDNKGKKDVEKNVKMFLDAFPDGKLTPTSVWAAGDYVFSVSTFAGKNDGDMGEMKKTGKSVSVTVVEIAKFQGGKYTEIWRFYNGMAFAMQLGMMDPSKMGAPPAGGGDKPAAGHDKH